MSFRKKRIVATLFALAGLAAASLAPRAQAQSAPVVSPAPGPSRVDLYGGYAYFHPLTFDSEINGFYYQPINPGAVASISGYFTPHFGLQVEGGFHPNGPNDCVYTGQAGPVFRFQTGRWVPFVHVLGGGAKVGGPVFQPCTWGVGATGGGGLDYILSKHFALRPIQADMEYSHVNYGPLAQPVGVAGGIGDITAFRLSAGLVIRFGDMVPPTPMQLTCSVNPASGFPGDPLTVSANPGFLNPKKKTTYSWQSSGGKITGSDVTASIDTTGLAPGSYTVSGHVSQGTKPDQQASCTASFTIKAFEPPTISCSANPSSVNAGDPVTITSVANSPQNRPLTYSYAATAGRVEGNTATATLETQGATPGAITVTCNVVDDRGQSASAQTPVTVMAPPAPPAPQALDLCSLSFDRDRRRPVRVDNESKACLDDIALELNRDPQAHLVIIGHNAPKEKEAYAAERALNARQYLTDEKGIDPSRITVDTGDDSGRHVDDVLVPLGVTLDRPGLTPVNEKSIHRTGQPYGKPRP